jgi:hypothetical protein
MDRYPTLPTGLDSRRLIRDGRVSYSDSDAIGLVRSLHPVQYDFEIEHPGLTAAQMTTLLSFISTHQVAVFEYQWPDDSVVYHVVLGPDGVATKYVSAANGGTRSAIVKLSGVA